jgi:hypothetical protein
MKIEDIYRQMLETFDSPLPYHTTGSGSYQININNTSTLIVNIRTANIDSYKLLTILFRDPNSDETQLTNAFEKSNPVRVFSTIIKIIQSIPSVDIVVFIPDDIKIDIADKKANLYKLVMNRLYTAHKLISIGEIQLPSGLVQYGIMPKSDANSLTELEIKDLLIKFAQSKQ